MASRNASRLGASASSSPAPSRRSLAIAQPASTTSPQLLELRRQWKWAAVNQFLYTFAQLVALEDVSLVDVEEDLINSTMIVLPRLMQRLLVTLTQDRKITVDNWQSALRRQYLRRDPAANPIGVEPMAPRYSRAATIDSEIKSEERESILPDDADIAGGDKPEPSAATLRIGNDNMESDHASKSAESEPQRVRTAELPADEVARKSEDVESIQNIREALKDWADLPMLEKLESLHAVIEWHFQSPLRLRSIMRSDDDFATWRIEPIGYDSKKNAYWFIGGERLWIQRMPPKPPKKATKRKASSNADNRVKKVARIERGTNGKMTTESKGTSKKVKLSASKRSESPVAPQLPKHGSRQNRATADIELSPSGSSGRARAAKTQANVKLDLQAKQLAAVKAEMEALNRRSTVKGSPSKTSSSKTVGIRLSRRLRGSDFKDDDEWQPIPEEWLANSEESRARSSNLTVNALPTRKSARNRAPQKKARPVPPVNPRDLARSVGLESDDESDLTELSDSEAPEHAAESTKTAKVIAEANEVVPQQKGQQMDQLTNEFPPGFIQWETICVSLQEWDEIAHRFEKATHYHEKALHKLLVQEIVPFVTESLREIERQRQREEALMNRKRSSRIAIKEMEKESARAEAARRAEEREKMARLRRLEARQKREDDERLQRERAREQRRKEREERELARSQRLEGDSVEPGAQNLPEPQPNGTEPHERGSSAAGASKPSRPRSKNRDNNQASENENWELDCEICGSKGINRDDGIPLMSCGKCNKWQHIPCHDAIDKKAGRPLRNWDIVDFFCEHCRVSHGKTKVASQRASPSAHTSRLVNGREYHGIAINGHRLPSLVNGQGQSYNVPASYQQLPGISSFTGFTHYQPHQRGFSPHPSIPTYSTYHHLQAPATSTVPARSPTPHGAPGVWESYAHRGPPAGLSLERTMSSLPQQAIPTHPTPSYPQQQPYGTGLDGSALYGSTPPIQHPNSYFTQSTVYSNPASHHTQS